jgi:hypothetical protein
METDEAEARREVVRARSAVHPVTRDRWLLDAGARAGAVKGWDLLSAAGLIGGLDLSEPLLELVHAVGTTLRRLVYQPQSLDTKLPHRLDKGIGVSRLYHALPFVKHEPIVVGKKIL